jgi:L-alanine-DL-glutamate epimerase-like enolase superfamily enzyme
MSSSEGTEIPPATPIRIQRLLFRELHIPFKQAFRHAAAERAETASVWVEAVSGDGATGYGESCPRAYVTGETVDSSRVFFDRHEAGLREQVTNLASLRAWAAAHANDVDANPAAWCALELAILDLAAKANNQPMEAFLSLPGLRGPFRYTAVLGDAAADPFRAMAEEYRRRGFTDFKVKLSGDLERDRSKFDVLRRWDPDATRIRVDANNLWATEDDAITYIGSLAYPVFAVEEPIHREQYGALAGIAAALNCRIVLDESFVRAGQIELLAQNPGIWLINVRVSKMGGLLRSLAIVEAARTRGIGVIVGAQVGETSVLTRAALTVAQAAGKTLVAQEGAFGTFLLERDVCATPLMFGAAGVLDVSSFPSLSANGLGLACQIP